MTWYEGRFGAYLKEPYNTMYRKEVERVMNTQLPEFETFAVNHITNRETPKVVIEEVRSVYEKGETLRHFFEALYGKYDKTMGCILLQPWIDTFMKNVGLHTYIVNHEWFIKAEKVDIYKLTDENTVLKINRLNNTRKARAWNNMGKTN